MDCACCTRGERRNAYIIFSERPERKKPLRRCPMLRLEDNIKMGLKEIWQEVLGWIHVVHYRHVTGLL